MQKINLFIVLRIIVGALFIVSGGEKLLSPYQNFLYVVQNYEVFHPTLEEIIARVLPWVELFLGVFICLGLWLRISLQGVAILFIGFICIVAQAMVRQLPITDCGCFGEIISFPLYVVLLFDSTMLALVILLIYRLNRSSIYSLDAYFENN